nr:oligosaccharide translocation protein RFT1-like [Quercus suber]POF15614.1 oligosaccharide translocation protein rft1 [Quercus suber]
MEDDEVAASAKGATFLILLQIGSRAVTFALNQLLLRFLSPQLLGVAVQLELYLISTLYFSRESLRIATQRKSDGGVQAAVNLSYLAIIAGIPLGAAFAQMYLGTNYPDVPYLVAALRIHELTALIELFSEPAFVAVQQNMLYKTRAAAEASAVVVKTFVSAGLVIWSHRQDFDLGVLPLAAGEFAYSATLTVVYLVQTVSVAKQHKFSLLPTLIKSSSNEYLLSLFSKPLLSLTASLYLQTGIKWLLTEGDKFLIAALSTIEEQGMYALSANYGGLIARMVFRPIEDSSRNLFANLCGASKPIKATDTKGPAPNKFQDAAEPQIKSKVSRASQILGDILRTYSLISLIAFALGPKAAPLLLSLVAGAKWTSSGAGDVLATYCYCIPLLALNGVSEAFVSATASTKDLQRQSLWMGFFSVGFAVSAYTFLRVMEMGARGLVLANCVNMALRIVFNLNFAKRYFRERGVEFELLNLRPNMYAVGTAAVAPGLLSRTDAILRPRYGVLGELASVSAVGAVLVMAM